jgi:integrase
VAKRKRRGSGEGTISYRNKEERYEGKYTIQTSSGPKRKTIYGKTYAEVRAKLAKAIGERDAGLIFDAENLSVAEYLDRWLKVPATKNVRPSTYARYEQLSRKHLIPALGRMKLKKLSAIHLEGLYEAKLEEGLAPRTVNYIHVTISKALRYAVGKDLIRQNVTSLAEAPQPKSPEMLTLNRERVSAFPRGCQG